MDPNVLCDLCNQTTPVVWFFDHEDRDEVLCVDCWSRTEAAHDNDGTANQCTCIIWSTAEVQ